MNKYRISYDYNYLIYRFYYKPFDKFELIEKVPAEKIDIHGMPAVRDLIEIALQAERYYKIERIY